MPTPVVNFRLSPPTLEALDAYPADSRTAALEEAVQCWANVTDHAAVDNAEAFTPAEWCMVADCCNGLLVEPGVWPGNIYLYAEVEDGHRLNRTGDKWLGEGKVADKRAASLVEKLRQLDYAHAWAMILAVRWFWLRCDLGFDPLKAPWWTVAYRRKHAAGKEG